MRLEFSLRQITWRSALRAAHGAGPVGTRPLIVVRIEAADGCSGYGEAAPLESYDGVGVAAVLDALSRYQTVIGTLDVADRGRVSVSSGAGIAQPDVHAAILRACLAAAPLAQAIAAVDMALWDLAGRRRGLPVWQLLGGSEAPAVSVNATIGAEDPLVAEAEVTAALAMGFQAVKVKVGAGDDVARIAGIRAAGGDDLSIRVDANGAWDVARARVALEQLARFRVEFCEEPVHGVDRLAELHRAGVPVALSADETAADPRLYGERVCDGVCLKVARCGGITGVLREAEHARRLGYRVYLASTLDGPLGIAAALHLVAAVAPDVACGLATLGRLDGPDLIPVEDGTMTPPGGPGLGDGLPEWYGPR